MPLPAALRFVSYEPALGPVNFRSLPFGRPFGGTKPRILDSLTAGSKSDTPWHLNWVIVGGESGPGARPFDLAWARSTIAQCRAAKVACFVKQLGACPRGTGRDVCPARYSTDGTVEDGPIIMRLRHRKGADPLEWPEDLRVREMPEGRS